MIMLGLVVTAGLLIGLIASRATTGSAAAIAAAKVAPIGGDPNAPHPSSADEVVQPQADSVPPTPNAESTNGEPVASTGDLPEMQGPANGDSPGTTAAPSTAAAAPSPLPATPPAGEPAQ